MYKQYIKQAVQMLRENFGNGPCDRHGVGDGIGVPD